MDKLKQQISCSIDDELNADQIESLLDKLLEDSSDGASLRVEWEQIHTSSQLTQQSLLDSSQNMTKSMVNNLAYNHDLIKPQTSNIPEQFSSLFKKLGASLAIAASLGLVTINILHTSTPTVNSSDQVQNNLDKPLPHTNMENQEPPSSQIILVKNNLQEDNLLRKLDNSVDPHDSIPKYQNNIPEVNNIDNGISIQAAIQATNQLESQATQVKNIPLSN